MQIVKIKEIEVKRLKCDYEDCIHNKKGECKLIKKGKEVRFTKFGWIDSKNGEFMGVCLNYEAVTVMECKVRKPRKPVF